MSKLKKLMANLTKIFKFSCEKETRGDEVQETIAGQEHRQFHFETLVRATANFHTDHKLGEGGFGSVYRGKLVDGREIAVKKLSNTSTQGIKEFTNEARFLARAQHRNVVKLLGYCVHDDEKLLVYEYVANESLDKLLFKSSKSGVLDWKRRYEIIIGVAQGLLYLHEDAHSCIIHRDIKASNILLDGKWVPKIADFGMAHLFPEDQTHINTRVAGTTGYMAPEYFMYGNLSTKADVFSYGVVLLELISGVKNSTFNRDPDSRNLLEWAYKNYTKGKGMEIMDPILAPSVAPAEVAKCVQIGLLCTQSDPQVRPTMRRVVLMLSKKKKVTLQEPTMPGFCTLSYRKPQRNSSSSSTAGTSGKSNSRTSGFTASTTTNTSSMTTLTAGASGLRSPKLDPHGKRHFQG